MDRRSVVDDMELIRAEAFGDGDVLEPVEADRPEPGPGEVRIEVEAAGVNFADVMQRRGEYPGGPEPPFTPGMEAAGTVDSVGENVSLRRGDRVVAMIDRGGYAEYAIAEPESVFPIPEGMGFEEAAGFPVQFLTAHGCLFEWGGLERGAEGASENSSGRSPRADGERVLIHATAGGVGTAAVQLASRAGAEVFGTASTGKLEHAAEMGCDHPIDYTEEDFVEEIRERTDGEGVDLVLDGVGGETFERSPKTLVPFGRIVTYDVASGEPGRVETPEVFFRNASVIGYHLGRALRHEPNRVLKSVSDLTEGFADGELEVSVGETFPLAAADEAHGFVESRESTGKVVLVP
jgi:NADPH:quinone reductase